MRHLGVVSIAVALAGLAAFAALLHLPTGQAHAQQGTVTIAPPAQPGADVPAMRADQERRRDAVRRLLGTRPSAQTPEPTPQPARALPSRRTDGARPPTRRANPLRNIFKATPPPETPPAGAPMGPDEQPPRAATPTPTPYRPTAPSSGWEQPPAVVEPRLEWQVENPFRFFKDPADTAVHRAVYDKLSAVERRAPVLNAERALAMRHRDGWAATMASKTCWDARDNRYGCPSPTAYIRPKAHTVIARMRNIGGDERDAQSVDCTWVSVPRAAKRKRPAKVTLPCDTPVKLKIPYPAGADVTVTVGGRAIAKAQIKVEDLLIVGLGDSFASGEGNPDVPVRLSRERSADYGGPDRRQRFDGYPARVGAWRQIGDRRFIRENARWLDQACHRSLYSHQLRAALQLALEVPSRAVTFVGLACSGAETTRGLFLRYKGNEWVPNPPGYSQISAVARAQCAGRRARAVDLPEAYHMRGRLPQLQGLILHKCAADEARPIDLLFLSVGGNDIGFSRLVANAVLSDRSNLRRLGGWIGQVHGPDEARAALARLPFRYKSLNRAFHAVLHMPWSEPGRIILTAYPRMALLEDGRSVCPDGALGMGVFPAFQLSARKAKAGGRIAERLFKVMQRTASTYGWSFAATHRAAFRGRGICAGWSGATLNPDDDLRLPRKVGRRWIPYNPADWRPYAPRLRWFRTPNDAFMTGNFHVSASLAQRVLKLQRFSWFQLLLASTYSGAFHPTAEGQAAIADAVVMQARQALKRYGPRAPYRTRSRSRKRSNLPPRLPPNARANR
ncbi:MAG: hypothetical protein AAFR04_09670 [Pseudomonadota bacterium]